MKKVLFLLTLLTSTFVTAAHLENEFLKVNAHPETGIFNLGTIDDEALIDGYPDEFDKAFFVINYDGTALTNFPSSPETAPLLDTTMLWEDSYLTTQWAYDDLHIWQKLRFLDEDSLRRFLNIELAVYNEGDSHSVGIQYLIDLKIGENDNPGLTVPWGVVDHETIFTELMPGYFAAYEDIEHHDSTALFAMGVPFGRSGVMPDLLALANSSILDDISFEPSISGASLEDVALLLRWNERMVHPTSMIVVEFNWGLPFPGFDAVTEITKITNIPVAMELRCFPNPFNSVVSIDVFSHFPVQRDATVEIYSISGQKITTIHDGPLKSGNNQLSWQPQNQASGVYLIVQTSGNIKNIQRTIYLK